MLTNENAESTNTKKSKSSVSESGHAKNIGNFSLLTTFVTGYGVHYNPIKNGLKLPQLHYVITEANAKLAEVINKNTAYNQAVNERILAFSDLRTFSTRLINALEATDAPEGTIKNAKAFNRKLQGKRAGSLNTPVDPNAPVPLRISASQLSYDLQIQHLAGLISVLESESSYMPNETELNLDALADKLADLIAKNNAVSVAHVHISNARISRDKTLYGPATGLVDIAIEVKKYIKSVFGATSPEFAQVKGIGFRKVQS